MSRSTPLRRVCIAPCDVASYYSGLRDGFAALGVRCWFFDFEGSPYTRYRPTAEAFFLERWVFAVARASALQASAAGRILRAVLLAGLRLVACICAAAACDVFVFGFTKTFMRGRELPILRMLGRTVICVFNGSDTRPPWMSGIFVYDGPSTPDAEAIVCETRRQQRVLRWIERWANATVCHPLSAHLLQRQFFNHLKLGHPCGTVASMPAPRQRSNTIRLLHAPSRPLQKGSDQFRAIVRKLRAEGHQLELVELVNRPNHEVLAEIERCDLVLDECFSDIPLAGLGSEAACAGRPAVVGGYGAKAVAEHSRGTGLPMALFVNPDDLELLVRKLVESADVREQAGCTARNFLREVWAPRAVAERFLKIADGSAPSSWKSDPTTITYWHGWGAPESAVREAIRVVVARHGVTALGLSHNPLLERRLTALAAKMELIDAASAAC